MTGYGSNCDSEGKEWLFWRQDLLVDILSMDNQCCNIKMLREESNIFCSFVYAKCGVKNEATMECTEKIWL